MDLRAHLAQRTAPLTDHREAARAAGPWLVLAADEQAEALAAHLRDIGAAVAVARPGPEYAQTAPGEYVIKAGCAEDTERMLTALDALPASVVHAFGLGSGEDHESGYGTALALTMAYSRLAPDLDLNLLVVTEGTLSVAGTAPAHPGMPGSAVSCRCWHRRIPAGPVATWTSANPWRR